MAAQDTIQMSKMSVTLYKPIYIGFCVLDISKTLLYRFHYEVMRPRFGDKAKAMYQDTDSIIYCITDDDVYEFMKENLCELIPPTTQRITSSGYRE